jgi:osmotically inducible protein OsmC
MTTTRRAETSWKGGLTDGSGSVALVSSGVGRFDVTWASRAEQPDGRTSPEELIAAAHSACYSMALSNGLAKAGHPPAKLETSADVDFTPGAGITQIRLTVRADVPGMQADDFNAAAEQARANCPVSKALTGVEILLDADLG